MKSLGHLCKPKKSWMYCRANIFKAFHLVVFIPCFGTLYIFPTGLWPSYTDLPRQNFQMSLELCHTNNYIFTLFPHYVCPSMVGETPPQRPFGSHTYPLGVVNRASDSHYLSAGYQYNFKVISQLGSLCKYCSHNFQMAASLHLAQNSPPPIYFSWFTIMKSLSILLSFVRHCLHLIYQPGWSLLHLSVGG